jgi:hypothetical protein
MSSNRNHFTHHILHLNTLAKDCLTEKVALFIKVTSSPKNTTSPTWLEDGENFAQQRDPQEERIYVAVHNIQVIGEMNDHVIHDVASESQDKDPLAPT